jgi:Eco57I restriction-modification methylase
MNAFSGTLVSLDVLPRVLSRPELRPSNLCRLVREGLGRLGPAASARGVYDLLGHQLFGALGFGFRLTHDAGAEVVATLVANQQDAAILAVTGWGGDLVRARAASATTLRSSHLRWWIGLNGPRLRIVDLTRVHARRQVDVDVERLAIDELSVAAFAGLLTPGPAGGLPRLDEAVDESIRHRRTVGRSLQKGVEEALSRLLSGFMAGRRQRRPLDAAFSDALTLIHRILFLLFAEARGLVPQWHPIYRNSYTIESLVTGSVWHARSSHARSAEMPPAKARTSRHAGSEVGLWESMQAITRLAHRGCRAGTLRVTPFNGRLFAPASAPLADTLVLDDGIFRDVLVAITTRPSGDRRERITYADLGVEQLGAVYERVLDFRPEQRGTAFVLARSGTRKATGTFYTPRAMTEYLVRRTLAPLVAGRTPDQILSLRVLDPAMGSGAFLVAACRYLADAYERALIREGPVTSSEVGPADRASFRRLVAQRCLYGVDFNPIAVQLARLSLWLCTLAADRPLTFFDHHLRAGNSLAGAAPRDIYRQPAGRTHVKSRRAPALPLFDVDDLHADLAATLVPRVTMASQPDDTAADVRAKEKTLAALEGPAGPLALWRRLADAWCAAWFWSDGSVPAWSALAAAVRDRSSGAPAALEHHWLQTVTAVSARERFFHWELEFPEVFFDEGGNSLTTGGFDAVLGNPPWDTLRGDSAARALTIFSRESGCYRLQGKGHANLYQLFAERMLQLVKPGGRLGALMPAGLTADHGCRRLREALIERCRIDSLVGFDNREAIFPIHRGVRFVLLTADAHQPGDHLCARFGMRSAAWLDEVPDRGPIPSGVTVPTSLLKAHSGQGLAVPELTGGRDREILARIVDVAPTLGSHDGWHLHFGRELNATDDRRHFGTSGLPVLEGKLIEPFNIHVDRASQFIDPKIARKILGTRCAFDRPRLAYREVAASTNRLTLIAAIVPADSVTTHTIFCLREPVQVQAQWFLCGMFNSFVANYLVRLRGGTHVTSAMMDVLRIPKPAQDDRLMRAVASLARGLSASPTDMAAYARLQAAAASLYGLSGDEFEHVLGTFPLVAVDVREACFEAFRLAH